MKRPNTILSLTFTVIVALNSCATVGSGGGDARDGVLVPSRGSPAFLDGRVPGVESVPTGMISRAEFQKAGAKALLCEKRPDGTWIDHQRMLDARTGLYTWTTPSDVLGKALTLLSESIIKMYGHPTVEKFGIKCVDDGAVIRVNDLEFGPYDNLWGGRHSVMGTSLKYVFMAWSNERRELFFIDLANGSSVGFFSNVDLSAFIPKSGYRAVADVDYWGTTGVLYLVNPAGKPVWRVVPKAAGASTGASITKVGLKE